MRPSQIFKKSEAIYDVLKVYGIVIVAVIIVLSLIFRVIVAVIIVLSLIFIPS